MSIDTLYDKRVSRFEADCWSIADFFVEASHVLVLRGEHETHDGHARHDSTAIGESGIRENHAEMPSHRAVEDTRRLLEAAVSLRVLPLRLREIESAERGGLDLRAPMEVLAEESSESLRVATLARLAASATVFVVDVAVELSREYVLRENLNAATEALELVPTRFIERLNTLIEGVRALSPLLAEPQEYDRLRRDVADLETRYIAKTKLLGRAYRIITVERGMSEAPV